MLMMMMKVLKLIGEAVNSNDGELVVMVTMRMETTMYIIGDGENDNDNADDDYDDVADANDDCDDECDG